MMDPAELQQQMMDKMLVGALEQVERAVDDELQRVENVTVRFALAPWASYNPRLEGSSWRKFDALCSGR
eukprot:scaffold151488_cov33-Tisochrysis_lutea.AAC.3